MKKAAFRFQTFSRKQRQILNWWCQDSPVKDKDGIICDGAIRSGKTVCMALSFVMWAMATFNAQNFGMCGKTIGSFRRNVLMWLKPVLRVRGYRVVDHRSDNLLEVTRNGSTNLFYIFGGKDERAQDLIQGITLAGLFLDEAALMPESFVNQATGRCSVEGAKFWFNCNPEGPDHYIKVEWIDKTVEKNLLRLQFAMMDNPSLSQKTIERYQRMYKGVFYERFILGLWVLASGIIFRYFAENPDPYCYDPEEELFDSAGNLKVVFSKITMGIDFGGNGSKTTFVTTGYIGGYRNFRQLEIGSLPVTEAVDSKRICNKFIEFYQMMLTKYKRVDWILPDSASSTMINSLISAAREAGLPYRNIKGCRKNEIADRPKTMDMLLNSGRFKFNKNSHELKKAIASLRWDEKKPDIPEDKNIGNCNDWYDALMYCMLDYIEWIDQDRGR